MFSCEFCEIFKNTFFTEHLQTTASVQPPLLQKYTHCRAQLNNYGKKLSLKRVFIQILETWIH